MIAKIKKNRKNKKTKSIFFSVLITFILLLIVSFLVVNNVKISQKRTKLNAQINTLKIKIQQAEEKKKGLENKISQIGSEENLEEIAYDQLNLKKPGEAVVVVKKQKEENSQEKEENKNLWEWVKSIFNH